MKILIFVFLCAPLMAVSQQQILPETNSAKAEKEKKGRLTNEQWNTILNRGFLSVLGSKGDNGGLGSFASFDPVAGAFTFKGTIPVGNKEKKISYISLALKGDLISDSYAKLFTDSKLNSNVGAEAQFHLRLKKSETVLDIADVAGYKINQETIYNKESSEVVENTRAIANRKDFVRQNELGKKLIEDSIVVAKKEYETQLSQSEKNAESATATLASRQKDLEEVDSKSAVLKKLEDGLAKTEGRLDSIKLILKDESGHSFYVQQQSSQRSKKAIEKLDSAFIPTKAIDIQWLTFTAGGGKKKYYIYDPSAQYSSQINSNDTAVFNFSVVWNYFRQSLLINKTHFLNVGISITRDNNAALLTTQQINQEIVVKNVAGDSVRKLIRTYQAYTEPLQYFTDVAIPVNYYFLFGKKTSGFHIFPSLHFPNKVKSYFNLGAGYIISFVQSKKEQPIVNLETYIQFNDMFNNLDINSKFWNRNEIGIRLSLPFNLMSKK